MKRYFLTLVCAIALLMPVAAAVPSQPASAVNVFGACGKKSDAERTDVCHQVNSSSGNPIIGALKTTLTIFGFIVGFAAIIMVIIGAISMITSSGDPQKVSEARNTVLYAIIGIVIAVFSEAIVGFVLNKL